MHAGEKQSWGETKLTYFLATMMIIVGLLGIQTATGNYDGTFAAGMRVLGKVIIVVFGAIIFLMPNKSNMKAIGLYAIALGAGRVFRSFNDIASSSDYMFYFGMIMFGLGCSLAYCGFSYLTGVSKNTTRMMLISGSIVVGYVCYILFLNHWGISWDYIFKTNRDFLAMMVMYVVYVAVLSSREIHNNIPIERIRSDLCEIANSVHVGEDVFISEDDMERIRSGFTDRSSWKSMGDVCPVESEIVVKIHYDRTDKDVVVQKWKGKDGLFLTMINDNSASFIRGYRFRITSAVLSDVKWNGCDVVKLFDDNILCGVLMIKRGVSYGPE